MNHLEFVQQCIQDLMATMPKSAQVAIAERAGAALQHFHVLEAAAPKDGDGVPENPRARRRKLKPAVSEPAAPAE